MREPLQKFEIEVPYEMSGDGMYRAKKAFAERGWKLTWIWYRRSDPLILLAYAIGVDEETLVEPLILNALKEDRYAQSNHLLRFASTAAGRVTTLEEEPSQ